MELRQLRYFLKAKELLNFTEAANELYISQSTLSQQIKQLEEELKTPLFNRIGKRISLTEAGEIFSNYAASSLKKSQDGLTAIQDLNHLNAGTLTIGVTYGLRNFMTNALIKFAKNFPNIKLEILFGTSEELIEKLYKLELDFVLTFRENTHEKELNYTELFTSPMVLVVAKHNELSKHSSITLNKISELPLVLPTNGFSTTRFITEAFKEKQLNPTIKVEINDIPTLLDLVRIGQWNTILAQTTVENEKDLLTIPICGSKMNRTAMIIKINDVYEKKSVREFCQYLAENIK